MIYSMTGYAAVARELPWGALGVELRSVNHRYLDVSLRIPDELRSLEPALREAIAARLQRGKIECRVQLNAAAGRPKPFELNTELLAQLRALETGVRAAWPSARELSVSDIVRWPGMLGADALPLEELRAASQELLAQALEEFNATRAREGERLKALLLERVAGMERIVAETAPKMPQIVAAYSGEARIEAARGARRRRRGTRPPGGRALRLEDRRRRGTRAARSPSRRDCGASSSAAAP